MKYTRQNTCSIIVNGCPFGFFEDCSKRRIKENSVFLLNLCPPNISYVQWESVEDLLLLSPSRIDIIGCADRTLSS